MGLVGLAALAGQRLPKNFLRQNRIRRIRGLEAIYNNHSLLMYGKGFTS